MESASLRFGFVVTFVVVCSVSMATLPDKVTVTEPANKKLTLSEGDSFRLVCQMEGGEELEWRHQGMPLTSTRNVIGTGNGTTVQTYEGTIKRRNDGGTYTCRVKDDFLDETKDTVDIRVRTKPVLRIREASTMATMSVEIFSSVDLHCDGVAGLNATWLRDKKVLVEGDRVIINRQEAHGQDKTVVKLTLVNVTKRDAGDYTCNDYAYSEETLSSPLKLTVFAPLRVRETSNVTTLSVDKYSRVDLHCDSDAGLTVAWLKDSKALEEDEIAGIIINRQQKDALSVSMLTLANVTRRDAGKYACKDTDDPNAPSSPLTLVVLGDDNAAGSTSAQILTLLLAAMSVVAARLLSN